MKLVLMTELHIQPSEIDKLDERTKWMYYYYIQARIKKENAEMKERIKETREGKEHGVSFEFPDDFISDMNSKDLTNELIKLEDLEK